MTGAADPRSDAELVSSAIEGAEDAFGALYDRYFGAVYDFVYRVTRSADDASDVVQDTFLQAMQSLGQLKNAASFKSWLFSIAHHVALRRLQRERRFESTAGVSDDDPERGESDPLLQVVDADRMSSPEQATEQAEMVTLVWQAAAALEKNQYALLDLHVRQGLDSSEIATVMGVSKGNASTMLNRMRGAVEGSIGSYLLARTGSKDCGDLARIVATAAIPPVSPELRRAIERHTRRCEVCTTTRRRLVSPMGLFAGLAAVPVPAGLQGDVWTRLAPRWGEQAGSADLSGGAGGEPPPRGGTSSFGGRQWWTPGSRRFVLFASIGVAAIIALILLVASLQGSSDDGGSLAGPPPPTSTASFSTAPSPAPTSTPSFSTAPSPTSTPSFSTAPSPTSTQSFSTAPSPTSTPSFSTAASPTTIPATATPSPAATPTETPLPTAVPPTSTPVPPTPTPTPDVTAPLIQGVSSSVDPIGVNSSDPCPVEITSTVITATVTDPSGIASVTLVYTVPSFPLASVPMINSSGDVYSAVIGPLPTSTPLEQLNYHVEATDGAANLTVSPNQTITLIPCVN